MLPGINGIGVCRRIREHYDGHILMLTGAGDDVDQVTAIELGVDDYVVKPLQLRILMARIRMLLRRSNADTYVNETALTSTEKATHSQNTLQFGGPKVCKHDRSAYLSDQRLNLNDSEFDLLWLLKAGRLFKAIEISPA